VLREKNESALDEEMVEEITYNQWESTGRGNIVTKTSSSEEFIDELLSQLDSLVTHHLVFVSQAKYFNDLKGDLKEGEVIIVADFSENYAFVVQDYSRFLL